MDTKTIPEHKQWAINLTQEEFFHEFMRRNPTADSIPLKDEWLGIPPTPPSRCIDPVNPEDMEPDEPPKEHVKDKSPKGLYCRGHGCDRTFTHQIGRISHERRCKFALNTKMPNGKK